MIPWQAVVAALAAAIVVGVFKFDSDLYGADRHISYVFDEANNHSVAQRVGVIGLV